MSGNILLSLKDGERIDPSSWSQHSFSGAADQILKVRRVSADETGRYTCKGINGFGSKTFDFHLVLGSAQLAEQKPQSREAHNSRQLHVSASR